MRFRIALVGIGIFLLASAADVQAAKGVKKVLNATANRTHTGKIITINASNGTFQLRTSHHHKKRIGANRVVAGGTRSQTVQLAVTPATRVVHQKGTQTSLAALRTGQRVRVNAVGKQAATVTILAPHYVRGYVVRHRTHNYRPHKHTAKHVQKLHPKHHLRKKK